MSKNKPMTRIDLDYNKNLKYPDINDYLNDTVYASNLTEFPDNQANAATSFKLIQGTTEWNHKISLAGYQWRVYLGFFKLYGYNPDLEAIERMKLTIDFLNDGDPAANYVKIIRKRNTDLLFNVISAADPQSLPLVGAVNYHVDFSPTALEDIYDYVFSERWVQASEHYRHKTYTEEPDEVEKQAYINYLKYRIYSIKIPVSIEYYYINATEAGGVLKFNMSLSDLLPIYKNSVDFSSKVIEINPKPANGLFNFLKLSYTSSNMGKMQLKGFFVDNPASFEIEPTYRTIGTTREEITTDAMIKRLIIRQHTGFDLSFPTIKYTYDFLAGADTYPLLNDEEFDTYQPAPRDDRVDPLTIVNYQYGHKIKLVDPGKANPFSLYLSFSCANGNLTVEPHRYKFQIEFRQEVRPKVMDTQSIRTSTLVESAFTAGDFAKIAGKTVRTIADSVDAGVNNAYRVNAVFDNTEAVRMFTQRVGTKENVNFMDDRLGEYETTLTKISTSADGKTHTYKLALVWPVTTKLQGLYNILKARWIRLSISNVFQEIILQGTIEKYSWDQISSDSQNPAYILNLDYYPPCVVQGLDVPLVGISNSAQYPERDRINALNSTKAVQVTEATKVCMFTSANLGKNGVKYITYKIQNYIYNGKNTYITTPNSFFILNSYLVVATRLKRKDATYFPEATFYTTPKDTVLQLRDYLKYTVNELTGEIVLALDPKQLEAAAKTALKTTTLPAGEYTVYIISNLNNVANVEDAKVYKNKYVATDKFACDLVIGYRWTKVK
jgi:hypothetical protein